MMNKKANTKDSFPYLHSHKYKITYKNYEEALDWTRTFVFFSKPEVDIMLDTSCLVKQI